MLVSDAVVVHLAFAFQVGQVSWKVSLHVKHATLSLTHLTLQHLHAPRDVLERYRKLARDGTLRAQLKADFGARPLNHSCAATAPAAQKWVSVLTEASRAAAAARPAATTAAALQQRPPAHAPQTQPAQQAAGLGPRHSAGTMEAIRLVEEAEAAAEAEAERGEHGGGSPAALAGQSSSDPHCATGFDRSGLGCSSLNLKFTGLTQNLGQLLRFL